MKPKIIAWSKGFNVIPFENVLSVVESSTVDGQLEIEMTGSKSKFINIPAADAQDFVDLYNIYLCTVESLTLFHEEQEAK